MPKLTKTGGRAPLSECALDFSWGKRYSLREGDPSPEEYRVSMPSTETLGGKPRYYRFELSTDEAAELAMRIVQKLARDAESDSILIKPQSDPEALRRLADIIEDKQHFHSKVEQPAYSVWKRK